MHHKVVLIHPSYIIQKGITSLIKEKFEQDTIVLSSTEDLKNYQNISNSILLVLVDSGIEEQDLEMSIKPLRSTNIIKIVVIREMHEVSNCEDGCSCCFSLAAPKEQIIELIKKFLDQPTGDQNKQHTTDLTERETEVLKLVAFGKTNKEIADKLCISFHTVISHRKNISQKLGIKSISGLTVYAILNNLIDTDMIDPESLI